MESGNIGLAEIGCKIQKKTQLWKEGTKQCALSRQVGSLIEKWHFHIGISTQILL